MPEQLKYKMYDFEVTPPATAWETITARLNDDSQYSSIASRVNNYEVPPPFDTWNNIVGCLNETNTNKTETPVIKINRKIYRIAAAAIVIGLLTGAAWMLLNKTITKIDVAVNAGKPFESIIKEQNKNTAEESRDQQNNNTNKEKDYSAYNAVKDNPHVSQKDSNEARVIKYAIINTPSYNENPITIRFSPTLTEKSAVIRNMDILTANSNYLVVAGPDGQLTKISAKFANVIRYLNSEDGAEENQDNAGKESGVWKKRFREWRNKISQSTFIPSSVNFLDLMELKELIEEK
jgi:hypothetical protein